MILRLVPEWPHMMCGDRDLLVDMLLGVHYLLTGEMEPGGKTAKDCSSNGPDWQAHLANADVADDPTADSSLANRSSRQLNPIAGATSNELMTCHG